jgi:hypothetical protein
MRRDKAVPDKLLADYSKTRRPFRIHNLNMPRKPPTIVPFQPKIPSDWALDSAVEWLRLNDGADGEKEACHAVADWIEAVTGLRQRC